jgi:hypothetical protein
MAAATQVRSFCEQQNGQMHSKQVAISDIKIGVFQMPAVLQGDVLFRPQGNGHVHAHSIERALRRMRSMTEAS